MGSIPPELSLDVRPTYVPKTIIQFLGELTAIGCVSEKLLRLDDFVKRLEEEMRKIDAFKRELPLCMLLLNDAIVTLKDESTRCKTRNVEPILEEFIPLKKNCEEDEKSEVEEENDTKDKMNWMSSVQLWNTDDYKNIDSEYDQKQDSVEQLIQGFGEEDRCLDDPFQSGKNRTGLKESIPFKSCSFFPDAATRKEDRMELPVSGLSLLTHGIKNPRTQVGSNDLSSKFTENSAGEHSSHLNLWTRTQQSQFQSSRKQRRCWLPELHRRFVKALQQLGGSQVATPKQIRELMKVDGLTNDEVKSHLQKYRLHTRRLPAATATPADPSMVILGGLWMPKDQYGESSKQSSSQSGSPQGPLQLARNGGGNSTTEEEEEEDERSESYSWKSRIHRSGKDHSHTLWLCNFFFFLLLSIVAHLAAPTATPPLQPGEFRPSSSPAPAVAPPRPSHASAPFFAYSAAPLPYRYCSAASCPSAAPLPHTQRAQIYLSDVGVLVTSYGIYRSAAAHYARFTARRHHRAQQLHRRRSPSPATVAACSHPLRRTAPPARAPCAAPAPLDLALVMPIAASSRRAC
ncbi:hypothetical protein U1Q18_034960 [Sarracenia purpurea var. burkii]